MLKYFEQVLFATFLAICSAAPALAAGISIVVQSTTSTANSGLYDHLLPMFKQDTGITVHVVAVGTGQAIKNAKNCDGDVLLVHAKSDEEKFVAEGYGVSRHDVMYNDFIFVGPPDDSASIAGSNAAIDALTRIASSKSKFASRGDNSGTHKKEMTLWQQTSTSPIKQSGGWYLETGSGMGATLNTAVGIGAYTMTDRATWISFNNKQDYQIQVEGDDKLFNQYGIIMVNPAKCSQVKREAAQKFVDWMVSEKGQSAIAAYQLDGQQLFFPNAN
ncbi:MAG: substrate-binding domain-containing protein [Gammaproteobacteria bacterium]|nr:substrate-binding domain-containing protein [Gammaproteobacteria bacterium]MDH3859444.1 substrate-binding domain-containing protein [Gammaproteobacteria bacterium]